MDSKGQPNRGSAVIKTELKMLIFQMHIGTNIEFWNLNSIILKLDLKLTSKGEKLNNSTGC